MATINNIKTGDIVVDKTAGAGIKVDTITPTYTWNDNEEKIKLVKEIFN